MQTVSAKADEVERHWFVVDATDLPLGRLASNVASVIRGKHKPTFTPHVDTGDFVIVVNADKVKLTGNKLDRSSTTVTAASRAASRQTSYRDLLERKPEFPIEKAVKGMLPKNVLGREMFTQAQGLRDARSSARGAEAPGPRRLKLRARPVHERTMHRRPARTPPASARPPSRASGSPPAPARSPSTTRPPTSTSSARPRSWS